MIHSIEFHAMGSQILAAVESLPRPGCLDAIPGWFEAWENTFSRFRADSELNMTNCANGVPRLVSQDLPTCSKPLVGRSN